MLARRIEIGVTLLALCCAAASAQEPAGTAGAEAKDGSVPTALTVTGPRPLPALPAIPSLSVPAAPQDQTPSPAAGQRLTVREAVQTALANHPDVALSRNDVQSAAGGVRVQRSGLGPTVTVSLSQQTQQSFALSSGSGAVGGAGNILGLAGSTGAQAQQLLYDSGRTKDSMAAARHQLAAAEQSLESARNQTVLNVKRAFYQYLQYRRLTGVAGRQLKDQGTHLEEAQARYRARVAPWGDVARALASVASAQSSLAGAQRDELQARLNLAVAMGIDPRTPIEPAEEDEDAPDLPAASLVERALSSRPEVVQVQATVAAAERTLSAAGKGNSPQLNALAGLTTSNSTLSSSANGQGYVGISLQFSPFDSGLVRGKVQEARASLESARTRMEATRRDITQAVLSVHLDLQAARQQAAATVVQVASAEESLRIAEGRYRAGQGTLLDVTDAQTALNEARVGQVNARAQISVAAATLSYQLGQPADTAAGQPGTSNVP